MLLVDPRWMDKIQQSSPLPDPLAQSIQDLDNQMRDILEQQALSAPEKAHLYQQTLQRYLIRLNQYRGKPLGMVDIKPQEAVEEKEKAEPRVSEPDVGLEKSVLESVPAALKKKAERLLHHLKQNSDLRWNERGEISLQGQTIKNSNLIDLVNDVLRQRKHTEQPTGWDTFASALSQTNIAHDLIGHPERWAYISSQMQSSSSKKEEDRLPPPALTPQKTWEYIHSEMESLTKDKENRSLPGVTPSEAKKSKKKKQAVKRLWESWEK